MHRLFQVPTLNIPEKLDIRAHIDPRTSRAQKNGSFPNQSADLAFPELDLKITHDIIFLWIYFLYVIILNAFITKIKSRRNLTIWATQNDLISKFYCWCITVIAPNLTPC